MLLIFVSASVSFLTLGILFLRFKNFNKIRIPSWFLGSQDKKRNKNNFVFTKPPLAPFFLILFATFCFIFVYLPKDYFKKTKPLNKAALVWIDPSFYAKLSRYQNGFSAKLEAEKILKLGYENFGLFQSFEIKNGKFFLNYRIVLLPYKKDIINFIEQQEGLPPPPFEQFINVEKISKLLNENDNFFNKKSTLIAFSDGDSDHLQNLFSLKNYFDDGVLFKTNFYVGQPSVPTEIIPTELFQIWGEKASENQDFSVFNTQKSLIPSEARPHFYLEDYHAGSSHFSLLKSQTSGKNSFLFVGCTEVSPSPLELDPFGSLRSLVSFFGNDFIQKSCVKKEKNFENRKNLWKYRSATVWVVPLDEKINQSLNKESQFWAPEGFHLNYDTLVYTAASFAEKIEETPSHQKVPLQLESGSLPFSLYLAPVPPLEELGFQDEDNRIYKGLFRPFFSASDGTILAWKSSSLPFFYLRTPTSTPNGELGRSQTWTQFWFQVLKNVKHSNLSYIQVAFHDLANFQEQLEESGFLENDVFLEILDLKTLQFVPVQYLTYGLYRFEKNPQWLFVAPATQKINIANAIFPDFFKKKFFHSSRSEDFEKDKNDLRIMSLFFAFLGAFSLLILWKSHRKYALFVFAIFASTLYYKKSFSQMIPFSFYDQNRSFFKNPQEENNIPFRIAWCGGDPESKIAKKYEILRNILMARGTISLPKNLKINSCRPQEAEIWWTNEGSLLTAQTLRRHISNGGIFIFEGTNELPSFLQGVVNSSIGMEWISPEKRGMFYRSFYLLQSFNGCPLDTTKVLMLKKKLNAQAPYALVTSAHFLSVGEDCFKNNEDYRIRSFVNMMYSFLTTDYKEDQMQLPEILSRIRNLGLEP
jgi:hypothetical protein